MNQCRIVYNNLYKMSNTTTIVTAYAGWAVTAGIPVKLRTAHGISRPEVGSTKRIDVYIWQFPGLLLWSGILSKK